MRKCGGVFDVAGKKSDLKTLEEEMSDPHFWDDQGKAQETIAKANQLKIWIEPLDDLKSRLDDIRELYPEIKKSQDEGLFLDVVREFKALSEELEQLEIKRMLSSEMDKNNCYLSINAGAGGTESCDWALMLSRMYQRWAQKKGWKCEEIDRLDGDVAGVKNVTYRFTGPFAYGYAKAERGVHRLVRISPFDSNAKRHTSFASVEVTPELDEGLEIEIRPEDLRIDTYRSSGAGGQHVNTTDSAVRMTHIPTGIVMTCQKERSQLQNKETCLKMLKAKLYQKELDDRRAALNQISGEKREIAWGSQIRNYVFQPYTLVKDARTKYEEGNIQAVMDGEIDGFVNAYLKEFG